MDKLDKCRVCCCRVKWEDEAYNLLQVPKVAAMFTACTNLCVDPREEYLLPSVLCCGCYEELEKFNAFRTLCIEADTKWRENKVEVYVGVGVDMHDVYNEDKAIRELELMLARKSPVPPIEAIQLRPDPPIELIQLCPLPQMESIQLRSDRHIEFIQLGPIPPLRPVPPLALIYPSPVQPLATKHQSSVLIESTQIIPAPPTESTPRKSPIPAEESTQLKPLKRTDAKKSHQSAWQNKEENAKNLNPPKVPTKLPEFLNRATGAKRSQSTKKKTVEENKEPSANSSPKDPEKAPSEQNKKNSHAAELIEESSNQDFLSRFTCNICSKNFASKRRCQIHKQQHGGHLQLTEHMKTHTVNCFPCEQEGCKKKYRHKGTLVAHQKKAHMGSISKSHVCEVCGKAFDNLAKLRYHQEKHKGRTQLPFACEKPGCSLRFRKRNSLLNHTMQHKGIKKVQINQHTLERTWNCPLCSKVCKSSTSLEAHNRQIHEAIRKYSCGVCNMTFVRFHSRQVHEMIHTGESVQPPKLRCHRQIHKRSKPRESLQN
ncbi:zinc finger protein 391-like [Drosophila obscura]|uniref:zinc finger protein 391-like n=1 Tax=Drosophila obscura TaxID=7282 RepID=UPI001BB1BEB8|nr:zinc finger protein 391-like [Drosophila obscura]